MAQRPAPVRDLDWDPARGQALGQAVVGIWAELLARLPELPVSRAFRASELREALPLEIAEQGLDDEEIVERLRTLVFEGSIYPGHPGFFAYISGAGTVPGALADLVASGLNQNSGGFMLSPGGSIVEESLVEWLAGAFGLPEG